MKLAQGEGVDPAEIRALAIIPHVRGMLHQALHELGCGDRFPEEFNTRRHYREALLTYWMMHPNELQDPPAELELVESVRHSAGGRPAEFDVYRYRMPEDHWAGSAWILGLAGPFFPEDVPYSGIAAGFTLCSDRYGEATPEAIADRYVRMVDQKTSWAGVKWN